MSHFHFTQLTCEDHFYRPQMKLFFTSVCQNSVYDGGGVYIPSRADTPLPIRRPLQPTDRILLECILVNEKTFTLNASPRQASTCNNTLCLVRN